MKRVVLLISVLLIGFGTTVRASESSSIGQQHDFNDCPQCNCHPCTCLAANGQSWCGDLCAPANDQTCAPVCGTTCGVSWVAVGIGAAAIAGIVIALTADRGDGGYNGGSGYNGHYHAH